MFLFFLIVMNVPIYGIFLACFSFFKRDTAGFNNICKKLNFGERFVFYLYFNMFNVQTNILKS